MREFEKFEKNIINALISIEGKNNLNCINNILHDNSMNFFNEPFEFYLSIPQNNDISIYTYVSLDSLTPDKLNEFTTYINKKLLIIIDLFEYLEENDYIVSTQGNFEEPQTLGQIIVDATAHRLDSFVSNNIEDRLYKFADYSRKIYYVREKLKTLVENDFIIESERRYQQQVALTNRQLKYTLIGLVITAIALFVSIIFNIFQVSKDNSQEITIKNKELKIRTDETNKMSEKQLKELIENIKKIKFDIHTECYYFDENRSLK